MRLLLISLLCFCFSFLNAQTWTSKNVSMTGTSPGYWEYLPQGYNDAANANKKYPVILFLHGSGANGNSYSQINLVIAEGLPKVINAGNFPTSFTINSTTYQFIVIAPQISWTGTVQNMEDIVSFIRANYRVDNSRFYLTGLSQGGEVVMKWAANSGANAQKVAAMALACPSWYPTSGPAQIFGDNDVPMWFYHNDGDPTIGVSYTNNWVSSINTYSPTPLAQKTILTSNTHDSWTTMYNPSTNVTGGLNIYQWMLQYNRPNQADPNNPYKIVVLGSSTAAGTGASTTDSSWVKRMEKHYQRNPNDFLDTLVYNLGVSGTSTYNAMPSTYTPTGGRPSPDVTKNITYALNSYSPSLVIINFPSNDVGFSYTNTETINNLTTIKDSATAKGANTWILTTQPRDDFNSTQKNQLISQRNLILSTFPGKAINVFDTLAAPNELGIESFLSFGDGVHVNNSGHRYIFNKVVQGPIGESGGGGGGSGVPYQIPISRGNVINRNAVSSKDAWRLFDGNLNTRIDNNSAADFRTGGVYPYRSVVLLDSLYNITEVNYRIGTSNNSQMVMKFYNASNTVVGDSIILSITGYLEWKNVAAARSGVRSIEILGYSTVAVSDGLMEVQVKGSATGAASFIYPTTAPTAATDNGVYANGINTIGDRLNTVTAAGDTIKLKMAKAVRWYWEGTIFDYYPDTYNNALTSPTIWLDRYGAAHGNNLINQLKRWDIKPMMAKSGGSIKWLTPAEIAAYGTTAEFNTKFIAPEATQSKKYITSTDPHEAVATYNGIAKQFRGLVALWGSNAAATTTGITYVGTGATKGQNNMDIFETGNEESRSWKPDYYHTPKAYYYMQKAMYNEAKAADPNAKVFAAALPGIDTMFWKAVWFEHYLAGGDVNSFPADGFNFNHYINNIKSEQGGSGDTYGISPEKGQVREEILALKGFFDRMFPGKTVQWTEFGFATSDESPYDVNPIGAKTDRQVQADWTIRLKAVTQSVPFINRMYYYAFFEDFTGNFNSMAAVKDNFSVPVGAYMYSDVYPVGYTLGQELYTEQWYKWFSAVLVNGDSTGVWVTRKDHNTNTDKKLYKVWRGTDNGTTGSYTLTGLTGATSAKLYTLRYDRWLPDSTNLTISGSSVTFNVTEAMQWVEVTTSGTVNVPPSANAGADQTITLPTVSVGLVGSGTDSDGSINTYNWTKISGGAATITSPSATSTTVTGLAQGSYTFRLTVTDNGGATAFDNMNVTVNAAPLATGDTIYIRDVKRRYVLVNGVSRLFAQITYMDGTQELIGSKPSTSIAVISVMKRNRVINGATRTVALLSYADGISGFIQYKIL